MAPQRKTQYYDPYEPGTEQHRKFYATMAALAYGDPLQAPEGYYVDPSLSNRNRQVYVNPQTRHAVMAFRGTQPGMNSQGIADLSTDAALAFGTEWATPRFRNAVYWARKMKETYGNDFNYTTTGHSLGGSQSHFVQKRLGIPSVAFSAHTPTRRVPNEALGSILGFPKNHKGMVNYTTPYDPIGLGSLAAYFTSKNTHVVPQTVANDPHSLRNFLGPDSF